MLVLHYITQVVGGLAAVGALASLFYYTLCLLGARAFLRERRKADQQTQAPAAMPPVSILKPIKGIDPGMYESFRSHCLQDYPEDEIIFGVSDPRDPAIELVRQLQQEFPQHSIRLMVCEKDLGTNTKVSNLAQMLPEARYEHLVINDGDIRVPPDYLQQIISQLADEAVGLVTCLYRGVPAPTLGSRLESLGISTDFCAGVLSAQCLGDISFGLGATLALRRSTLQVIGGFEALLDHLADDYEIGHRTAGHGWRVKLSETVVETFLPPYTFAGFFEHQVRWARTVRGSRRWGYIGLGMTFGLPWAMLAVVLAQGALWSWGLLAVVCGLRTAAAIAVGHFVLHDPQVVRQFALLPLRDMIALVVWIVGFAGHTISWRGDVFRLVNGKLVRAGPART